MVHSAEWTPAMKGHLGAINKNNLIRRYGFGVPSLNRALRSLDNDVTLVIESTMQPFQAKGSEIRTKNLVLHQLPWPKAILENLGAADVELRVTLSYFIEPNPGERGQTKRHSYASHGLRFEVKRSKEPDDAFMLRINAQAGDRPKYSPNDLGLGHWRTAPQSWFPACRHLERVGGRFGGARRHRCLSDRRMVAGKSIASARQFQNPLQPDCVVAYRRDSATL